ncbi:MFS transporter [Psychrobacter sp.]|uniref:MFS transporter n=1 Tax=Psychrobacter sp. TaxID=56811 RepID=UPI0025DACEF0|nr:MFS transporter [Psychrobacter sp.]
MLNILVNQTYRHLFASQFISLIGTGLATVALGLLAFDLAGNNAGMVLGTALAIKMIAYVAIAPIASAFAERLPKRTLMVSLDLIRAGVALLLPFVSHIYEVYILIFVLQAASASYTPTFQATIPDILPDEEDYTKALSLSRLAYDMESLVSPMVAAALLTMMSFKILFMGTVLGFLASAILVVTVALPTSKMPLIQRNIYDRTTRGIRIFLATPRLRGLLAVNVAVSAAASMVFVNTVVIIQGHMGLTANVVAWALASFGSGSMIAAMALPRLLRQQTDRRVMLSGVAILVAAMFAGLFLTNLSSLMGLWFLLGLGYSAAQTPSGRLLWRSSHQEDRPALFAAQFALSHASWLVFYPLSGWLGAHFTMPVAFGVLGCAAAFAYLVALKVWPTIDLQEIEHDHFNLPEGHPHAIGTHIANGVRHSHLFVVDYYHPRWPSSGH